MAWNVAKETIEMICDFIRGALIPNINVGENERLSFHMVSVAGGCRRITHSVIAGKTHPLKL